MEECGSISMTIARCVRVREIIFASISVLIALRSPNRATPVNSDNSLLVVVNGSGWDLSAKYTSIRFPSCFIYLRLRSTR